MSPRVAIVHERFTEYAGSERVVEQLVAIWPDADVLVPVADWQELPPGISPGRVRTSALQRLYRGGGRYAHLLPLLPAAHRHAQLAGYDLVVTSHHAFANRVRPPAGTPLLAYVHSPARWMWEPRMRTGEGGTLSRSGLAAFAATQRRADRAAAQRADVVLANSSTVADRVRRWWDRAASVVHPPVDVHRYTADGGPREPFFLLAGRLVPYKRPAVAAEAAARAGVPLVVAGDGRARADVERLAGPQTRVLGRVSDEQLLQLYRRCRAVLLPGEEDFGIVPVEAQACGAPVVALRAGGALDSVREGVTGVLYDDDRQDPAAPLAAALAAFDADAYDPRAVRRHAESFAPEVFRRRVAEAADHLL